MNYKIVKKKKIIIIIEIFPPHFRLTVFERKNDSYNKNIKYDDVIR